MASPTQVKQYLAYWFQLGKRVWVHGGREAVLPDSVIERDRYSQEFEDCWQRILAPSSGECYLEGTHQTIQQLLSSEWEIESCARCGMPVPMIELGMQEGPCPCADLDNWPNNELPEPRSPVDSASRLSGIQERLRRVKVIPKS